MYYIYLKPIVTSSSVFIISILHHRYCQLYWQCYKYSCNYSICCIVVDCCQPSCYLNWYNRKILSVVACSLCSEYIFQFKNMVNRVDPSSDLIILLYIQVDEKSAKKKAVAAGLGDAGESQADLEAEEEVRSRYTATFARTPFTCHISW